MPFSQAVHLVNLLRQLVLITTPVRHTISALGHGHVILQFSRYENVLCELISNMNNIQPQIKQSS